MLCILTEGFLVLSVGGSVEGGWCIVVEEDGTGVVGLGLFAVGVGDDFGFVDVWIVVRRDWLEL